jgi:hypothetical protein
MSTEKHAEVVLLQVEHLEVSVCQNVRAEPNLVVLHPKVNEANRLHF